jgi:hypothetical protein
MIAGLTVKKKIIFIAVLGFCLLELLDWTGVTRGGFPSNFSEVLMQACVNIGWTFLFTAVSYFVMIRPRPRQSSPEDGDDSAQASDRRRESSGAQTNAEH